MVAFPVCIKFQIRTIDNITASMQRQYNPMIRRRTEHEWLDEETNGRIPM